jgi:hypothetical protein
LAFWWAGLVRNSSTVSAWEVVAGAGEQTHVYVGRAFARAAVEIPMSKSTTLAEGQITTSPHNTIAVELVEPEGMPAIVKIARPFQPTVCDPRCYTDLAAAAMKLPAEASTALARLRGRRRL